MLQPGEALTPMAIPRHGLHGATCAVIGNMVIGLPAGAFVVAAIATIAGTRWALIGPGLAIVGCAAVLTIRAILTARTATTAR